MASPDDKQDGWPAHELTPLDFEKAVESIVRKFDQEVIDREVQHLEPVDAHDGAYKVDVTVRFSFMGADFVVFFECKRHKRPVERSDVQTLHAKLKSAGAHKGIMVSASGYQSGALAYAKAHGIACVRLVDKGFAYETKDALRRPPGPTGELVAFAQQVTSSGAHSVPLIDTEDVTDWVFAITEDEPW